MKSYFRSRSFAKDTVLFLLALLVLVGAFGLLVPTYSNEKYRFGSDEEWKTYEHPFEMNTEEDAYPELLFTMNLSLVKPSRFLLFQMTV